MKNLSFSCIHPSILVPMIPTRYKVKVGLIPLSGSQRETKTWSSVFSSAWQDAPPFQTFKLFLPKIVSSVQLVFETGPWLALDFEWRAHFLKRLGKSLLANGGISLSSQAASFLPFFFFLFPSCRARGTSPAALLDNLPATRILRRPTISTAPVPHVRRIQIITNEIHRNE